MSTAGSARTRPASGVCRPHTSSSSVVLPQPLGPTTATISPAPTSRSTPSSARTEPNARLTPARLALPPPSTFRGSCAGASSLVVIAPSAGITPQVRRVSAGTGAISAERSSRPPWFLRGSTVAKPDLQGIVALTGESRGEGLGPLKAAGDRCLAGGCVQSVSNGGAAPPPPVSLLRRADAAARTTAGDPADSAPTLRG